MKLQQPGTEVRHSVKRLAYTMHADVARFIAPTTGGFVTATLCPIKYLVPNTTFPEEFPVDYETSTASPTNGGG